MKKILTVLILLIASGLFAQDTTWKANPVPPKVNGMYNQVYNGRKYYVIGKDTVAKGLITSQAVYVVNPSIAVTGTVTIDNSINYITSILTVPDTVGISTATKDSLTIGTCTWFNLSAVTKDSTVWVAFSSAPVKNQIQTIYAGSLFTEKYAYAIGTKVYYWHKTSNYLLNLYKH